MLKLAVFSANYRPPGQLDCYRAGLMRFLCEAGVETVFLQASDYIDDQSGYPRFFQAESKLVAKVKAFSPDAALFLNASGRVPKIADFLSERKIPSVSWFVDHPAFFSPRLLRSGDLHRNIVANTNFVDWFKRSAKQDVEYVPFPCGFDIVPGLPESERDIDALFMGTVWDFVEMPDWVHKFEVASGRKLDLKVFYPGLLEFYRLLNTGMRPDQTQFSEHYEFLSTFFRSEPDFMNRISNYFSALDRINLLAPLAGPRLSLYGPRHGWSNVIGLGREGFSESYRGRDVVDPAELISICRRAKLGVNLFHTQNQGGGMNFRFAEYLQAQTPILSNRNAECEREFPHGVAAWYCSSAEEFREASRTLLADVSLRKKLAANATQIAQEKFHVRKIFTDIFAKVGIDFAAEKVSKPTSLEIFRNEQGYTSNKIYRKYIRAMQWWEHAT